MKRRPLDLRTLDDVRDEIIRLRDHGYTARGKWNLAQICAHVSETIRIGIDGDEPRLPWILRKIFGVVFKIVLRTRTMMSGAPTVPRLTPPELPTDDPAVIDRCLATLAEARDFAGPLPPYPLMDGITLAKWKDLMVIHAQHHLRFLEPQRSAQA
ncbi:DUF1569 domain-containing protein [Botrimarina hoheduenensis]|uniref:DinB superfamily protein n=1 Tax=Botrimarina hoheduenensis TaxID=2528000 RepID=A0A5C5VZW6_9BACT|nr:DUF1569 domain-containing protein [Botrimarina hoheduenensis]TWT43331.1 hypothetical protein Pla111_22820 [Botrimarina hoheduenensis]